MWLDQQLPEFMETVYLKSGEVYIALQPTKVITVVGSCVSVLLFDKAQKLGGMNHFVHPYATLPGMTDANYGEPAMRRLLREFQNAGGNLKTTIAHVLGGGSHPKMNDWVGINNINVARQFLVEHGIRITHSETGDKIGRKIIFDTSSGLVTVKPVGS